MLDAKSASSASSNRPSGEGKHEGCAITNSYTEKSTLAGKIRSIAQPFSLPLPDRSPSLEGRLSLKYSVE
ncbi:hypothetical protein LMG28138_00444 [Pararobbsia alpina]|uniref:Uncharacterized protein n=1 Tax=Pararobbsia alpina TaxID=621374 RepID=A0A6S7AU83_9BURK|nr:hypothetical protein LMG28138_00444 [Pararobbsia alpina]